MENYIKIVVFNPSYIPMALRILMLAYEEEGLFVYIVGIIQQMIYKYMK